MVSSTFITGICTTRKLRYLFIIDNLFSCYLTHHLPEFSSVLISVSPPVQYSPPSPLVGLAAVVPVLNLLLVSVQLQS